MKALIDADFFLYRAAAGAQFEAEWAPGDWTYLCRHDEAIAKLQDSMAWLADSLPFHRPVLVVGSRVSFRYGIWPEYKDNRRSTRRPAGFYQLLERVRAVLAGARGWGFETLPDVEGDDVLALLAGPDDVIVSPDKDMLTVPCRLLRPKVSRPGAELDPDASLSWPSPEIITIDEADRAFYTQALTGDSSDNYPGCKGIGPAKAAALLDHCSTEVEMWEAVVGAYKKAGFDEAFALSQARCARILRPGEYDFERSTPLLWKPPVT